VLSPGSLAILLQEITGEEPPGSIAEVVEKAGEETVEETGTVLGSVRVFFEGIVAYLTSPTFIANLVATVIVLALAIFFYRLAVRLIPHVLRWRRPEEDETMNAATLARIKRQETAATLVRNTLRYLVLTIVALFIFSIFLRDALPAIGGAAILAAVVGFGAQSFLRDIIAGFFILFENQYSVGDFIAVEPAKASGLVEEFGLRTTKIRSLSDEIIYIPNGSLTAVTNYVSGQQRFTIEVRLKNEEAANRVLEEIQEEHELYLTPPRLIERDKTPEGAPRLRFLAGVLPSTAWLVEENLVERIKAAGEDGLAAEPLVYKVDSRNIQRLKDFMPENE
jgi:moderate conductance mechanosensitive channel